MKIEGSAAHYAKWIAKLEAQCDQLKLENTNLKEELTEAKGKEEEMIEMCAKVKDKYAKVKEEFGLKERKWREEEENLMEICRQVGVEKRKLEIDLKAAKQRITNSIVEVAQKLMDKDMYFKSLLEENNSRLDMAFEVRMAKSKEEFDLKERKWREEEEKIREECRQLNLKAANRGIEDGVDGVAKKLKVAEAEAEGLKSLLEEKDGSIITLLAKNEDLERQNRRLEMDFHANTAMEAKKHKLEEEKILELTHKIEILEGGKGQMEAEYCKLKEDNRSEAERIFNLNKALEAEKKRGKAARETITELVRRIAVLERVKEADKMAMEEEGKQKVLELTHRIEVLESEKREIEANLRLVNRETSEEINRILNEKVAIEVEKMTMEAENKKTIYELILRIEVLEREKKEIEDKLCQAKKGKTEEIERILNKMTTLEAEKKIKVDEGMRRIEMLEKEQNEMVARVCQAEQEKSLEIQRISNEKRVVMEDYEKKIFEKNKEIKRLMNEKKALEARNRDVEDEGKERASELLNRIGLLKKEKKELEAKVCQANNKKSAEIKRILIKKVVKDEGTKKVSDLVKRIEVLEEEKKEMEAKVYQAKEEKDEEIHRILNEKVVIEDEKRAVKEDYEKKILEFDYRNDIFEREKRGFEAEIAERDEVMNVLAQQNSCLEDKKEELEMKINGLASKLKVEEEKILELAQKIEVLEGEKEHNEAEYCNLKEDNRSKAERIFSVNKALEAEKKRGKIAREKITELVKWIGVLERIKEAEKIAMEDEGKKKVLELTHRIEVLEREKREIEAKVCQGMKEKSEEIERIQNVMMALEAEKRTSEDEGMRRIEVLKREKNEIEAKVCQAKQEMSEETQRILNEKRSVIEDYEKKIWELVDKNDNLERGKRGFEAEIAERDEVIKVLVQENSCLEGKKKELEMEINGLASKYAHLTNNVVMLSTPWQNEGQNSAGVAPSSEHNRTIINHNVQNNDGQYEDEMTRKNACKRKRSIGKWDEPGPTYGSKGGDVQVASGNIACEWEVDQDVLEAFDAHPELCLKAVCALYRQHQKLGNSTNISLSSEGIALAEYLISEDPEGRKTEKMVSKLDKFDQDAVGECINIAKQHYKQVFEIYKKKEDPVFLS